MRRHRPMIGAEIHFRGNGDLVFGAVNAEHAMHLHAGLPARRNSAIDMIRTEADLGETCALEHVFVHLAITALVATRSAGRVEDDLPADLSGRRIEPDLSLLQRERSLHGVQRVSKREIGGGLRGIALQDEFLRTHRARKSAADQQSRKNAFRRASNRVEICSVND